MDAHFQLEQMLRDNSCSIPYVFTFSYVRDDGRIHDREAEGAPVSKRAQGPGRGSEQQDADWGRMEPGARSPWKRTSSTLHASDRGT